MGQGSGADERFAAERGQPALDAGAIDVDGKPAPVSGAPLDEDRRRVEADRDRAYALLHTFIEAVPGVVYAKDREGRLIVGNRGVSDLLGVAPGEFIGKTDMELIADKVQAAEVMETDRRIMESGVARQIEEDIRMADGSPATWLSTKAPFRDAQGNVVGLIGASLDITDRKRIETALRLSEQRSALALDVAELGTWSIERDARRVELDSRAAQICGLAADVGGIGVDDAAGLVHPEDWPRVEARMKDALSAPGSAGFVEDFRVVRPTGDVAWVACRGQVRVGDAPVEGGGRVLIGTMLDVTERRRMIESLELGDRRKDEFLAMLAHELRNPLAPIGTAAQLLLLTPDNVDRVRDVASVIERQVNHMTDLVDDLLDVSRVTRGLVVFDREPVVMNNVIATAVEQVAPLLKARDHALDLRPLDCEAVVVGDRHRLVQVVSNLLNNAAKFTPPGGAITLHCEASADGVAIRVSDNGIGMEPDLVPYVFELFSQAARTPDRAQGGLGIGLALVRTIVQAHGGTVTAKSAGAGRGSEFNVVLPRADVAPPRSPPGPGERPPAGRRKVLVVDDNLDAGNTLAMALEIQGHEVSIATDGQAALDLVAGDPDWDVFILDIGMPDITGLELAVHLRQLVRGRPVRFIALTGYGQERDLEMSRDAGFDHHMTKPPDLAEILRQLGMPGRP